MSNVIQMSDYRKRRAVADPAALAGEFFLGASFIAAAAWIEAMEEAARIFQSPWPGGIDDLPI